jgi:hypothetical protein
MDDIWTVSLCTPGLRETGSSGQMFGHLRRGEGLCDYETYLEYRLTRCFIGRSAGRLV